MIDNTNSGTDEHFAGGGVGLTEEERQTLRRARIAKTAASSVTQADLLNEIPKLTPREANHLRRKLKLRAGAPLAAVARAVRSALARAEEEFAAQILHDCFHGPILAVTTTSSLTEDQLAAILCADSDELAHTLEALYGTELHEHLLDIEDFGSTQAVRATAWSSMVVTGHAGAMAALAWLLADPPTFWGEAQTDAARQVWQTVRERHPLLPEAPKPLDTLVELAATLDDQDPLDFAADEPATPEHTAILGVATPNTFEATVTGLAERLAADVTRELRAGNEPPALAELITQAEQIEQERQAIASGVLPALVRAVADGVPADTIDIARVAGYSVRLSGLLAAAAAVDDGDPITSLDAATAAVWRAQDAAAEMDAAVDRIQQVRRLTTLTGPEGLADDIAQVRALADGITGDTDAETVAALLALLELIELAGEDPHRAIDLSRTVSTRVPAAIPLLMFIGSPGALMVSDTAVSGSAGVLPAPLDLQEAEDHLAKSADGAVATAHVGTAQPLADAEVNPEAQSVAMDEPAEEQFVTQEPEPGLEDVLAQLNFTVPVQRPVHHTQQARAVPVPVVASTGLDTPDELGSVALYGKLLRSGELSLAYWLKVAEKSGPSIQAAHRLAALSDAMKTSIGSNATAFAATIADLEPGDLKDHLGMQMLVYGASVRAGLLSPIAGASDPLRDATTSIVRSGSAVGELTEFLQNAIYAGVYLTPRNANAVVEAAEAASEHDALAQEAATKLKNAPNRTIRYGPATDLWQTWMAEDGYLGEPLSIVASGSLSPTDLTFIRTRVAELRTPRSLEQVLDKTTLRTRGSKRTAKRIEARARTKLLEWTGDVTELLAGWVTATENLSPSSDGTWMTDPIADLRTKVATVREQALAELEQLRDSGDEERDAATDAGLVLLNNALDLLMGTALAAGQEIPSERALGGLLTLAPDVDLTPALAPRRAVKVADIVTAFDALRTGDSGWTAAFDVRANRHDQVGTQLLIETLRPRNAQLAQQLSAARDEAIDDSIAQVDSQAAELMTRIDSDRLFGRLSIDEWTDLTTRAGAYQPRHRGTRNDFDLMLDDLGAIEAERTEAVKATITAARTTLDIDGIPDGALERIQRCIDSGDLTTAAEYEVTIRSGGQLPGPREDIDHLSLFYQAFPDAFAAASSRIGAGVHPMLTQLRSALEAGTPTSDIPAGALADTLAAADIELENVGRGTTAGSRIEQWTLLANGRSFNSRISNVKSILEQTGFAFDKATTPPTRRGHSGGRGLWLDLHGVRATSGKALVPAFGSGMSPSGDSLRLLGIWRGPTPRELVEMLREEPNDSSIVVLYFGTLDSGARRELARLFRNDRRLPATIVLDDAAFAYLSCQPEPSREITMSTLMPFTASSPFTPDVPGASIRQEMFYGRSDERAKIIDMMGPCIVYGGRQLGKSALLLEAARKFDDKHNRHAIYESIFKIGRAVPVDAVWTTLWQLLAARDIVPQDIPAGDVAGALTRHVTKWISDRPGRQLLLLLDESDKFLDGDAEAVNGMFTHVTHFKELMERTERAVKVVFAGLHQTARFDRLANHPLAHFGEPVCVGPLAPQAAYDLLTRPLHALGYVFAEHDHAARVLALANNQPALIQLFAAQLLRNLQAAAMPDEAPPQTLHADDIERVWADSGLRTSFRKRFDWTLELDPRYKIIAYSVALHAHARGIEATMTPSELRAECETWWPAGFSAEDVRTGEFRALLDECVDLGVLSYTNRGYRLRTPNVLDLLGAKEEVEAVLDQAESIELPESFDGSLMRPVFGEGPTRGPLTSQQIADLLTARNQVRQVIGSHALTIERCLRALQDENEHAVSGYRKSAMRDATPATLAKVCKQVTFKAAGRHVIVIVDLKTATPEVAYATWTQARELIATHSGGTLGIVLVSGPAQAPTWPVLARETDMSSGLTELHRYDRTDLRLWMTETTLPFQDNAARDDLLAETGGWPIVLNKIAENLTEHGSSWASDPLSKVKLQLEDVERSRELVEAAGVRSSATLSQAWDFLVWNADEPSDLDTLADYLTLHGESGEDASAALTPTALATAGYSDMADVVEVLRVLGVVVGSPDDGQFRLERVMVNATRRVNG
ncbi:hypothetical protein P3102_00080 [Amycolatopsis sp. QT-25]|uniref:hypothetical protein n=1 Tax=Amycolatopsis sp. QT-25 TaxID=3034022 RepID=UPI0023EE2665|nr:hypothetical protein [Amycolatopsis sp. QT-25]WET79704.1 hypothetical protein P3102_00080 [Amycolatopsis sp. QT-25]